LQQKRDAKYSQKRAGQLKGRGRKSVSISPQQTLSNDVLSTAFAPVGRFYRFYSIDVGGRIALAEDHECENDSAAIALGNKLLSQRVCTSIEVWLDRRRVSVIENRSWLGA
jgi:hypothetical protein